jgi:hypothetical protein
LSILCDVKHHGNAKVSFTLYISTLKAKEQHRKNTKHVEIPYCGFKENDLLFLNLTSSLFLV